MPIGRVLVTGVMLWAGTGTGALLGQERRFEFAQVHMGMEVRLVLYAGESSLARAAAAAAFDRIRTLEDIMSDYRDESEARRLASRPGEWVPVSPDLYAVLSQAIILAERSAGAFDPTVGPIVQLWRMARKSGSLPEEDSIRVARTRTGWRLVQLDPARGAVRLGVPGMRLDLGGIAKGYILDQALAALRAGGVSRALIVAGGDIVAGDPPPGASGWRIATEGAGGEMNREASSLTNAALSTSGDSEQFTVIEGVRYSHVIDPRTGRPLTNRHRAYVIAGSGILADGLATAATVLDSAGLDRIRLAYPGVLIELVSFTSDSSSTPGSRPSRSGPSSGHYPPK